jgi:hypothetical protein
MKLRLPWQKEPVAEAAAAEPGVCAHPRVEVEMHGTAIKRRWCALCGADLPMPARGPVD